MIFVWPVESLRQIQDIPTMYISSTLEALNIEPGNFSDMYGEKKKTNNVQKDKLRKSFFGL